MTLFDIIAPPIVGAIIGYVTNVIAIKMLFLPRNPIKIGRFQVPFTPGIVPKRKPLLAGVLGKAISERFWGFDDLESIFLSDVFKSAVIERVMILIEDPDTKLRFLDPDQTRHNSALQNLKDEICVRIQGAILRADLKGIIHQQSRRIMDANFSGLIRIVLNEKTISLVSDRVVDLIQRDVLNNGRSIVMPLVDDELREISSEPVLDILNELVTDKDELRDLIGDTYASFMETHVRPIVESIDIGGMVTEKVLQMDNLELEELTLSVVNRELRYVMALGGLIGAIIGAVNIFI